MLRNWSGMITFLALAHMSTCCQASTGIFSHLRSLHRTLSVSDSENDEVENDEVVASEMAPESPESLHAEASPDIIEHASSESCSPPGPFDSPPHRRQKLDHMWRHSIPDYQVRPVAPSASSSTPGMDADTSLPPTKWGRCHVCGNSRRPFSRS